MLFTEKIGNSYIIGYVEFNQVNSFGSLCENGEYIRIENLWVHQEYREAGIVFKNLIRKIYTHPALQNCLYVYWVIHRDPAGEKIIDDEGRMVWNKSTSLPYNKEIIYKRLMRSFRGERICSEKY